MDDYELIKKIPNLSRNFLHACQSGDLPRVEALALKHNIQDWTLFRHATSGDTPLHVATREGHLSVVRYLCENFEKPRFKADVTNKDMKRPLHEAAQFAHHDVLKYLIEKGATIDSIKRADWTPLMLACTKTGPNACKCIATLLEAHACTYFRNKDGWTPFLIACRAGDENALKLILSHSPKCINDQSNNGRTAMHIAAFHGHREIIDSLMVADSKLLNVRDSSGSTPLHEAVKGGHLNATKQIVELNADVTATDNIGQTILHIAALIGNTEAVKYILKHNFIDVNLQAFFGVTPLAAARRSRQVNTIQTLMEYGAK